MCRSSSRGWSRPRQAGRLSTERAKRSAPVVAPAVVVDYLHAALTQDVEARRISICLAVIDAHDVGVDDHLGAHHARRGADEHYLPWELSARLDQTVGLRVEATTKSRLGRVAAVG